MGKGVSDIENFVRNIADDVRKSFDVAEQAENEPIRPKTGFFRPKSAKTCDGGRLQRPSRAGWRLRKNSGWKFCRRPTRESPSGATSL
jgi:hypothetical protein